MRIILRCKSTNNAYTMLCETETPKPIRYFYHNGKELILICLIVFLIAFGADINQRFYSFPY